jgi:lysyl-tRNA synthetase class II
MSAITTSKTTTSKTFNPDSQIINLDMFSEEQKARLQVVKPEMVDNPIAIEYEPPKKYEDYTKLENGDNLLRILSNEAIDGCEYWEDYFNEEKQEIKQRPIRLPAYDFNRINQPVKVFNAFFVWNYKAEKIQILCTTKKTIYKRIQELAKDKDWGDLTSFDIRIRKQQQDPSDYKTVEYSVSPKPNTVLDPKIAKEWQESGFNRNALMLLFAGIDPFEYQRKAKEQIANQTA